MKDWADYFYVDENGTATGVRYMGDYMGKAVVELDSGVQKRVDPDDLITQEEMEERANQRVS